MAECQERYISSNIHEAVVSFLIFFSRKVLGYPSRSFTRFLFNLEILCFRISTIYISRLKETTSLPPTSGTPRSLYVQRDTTACVLAATKPQALPSPSHPAARGCCSPRCCRLVSASPHTTRTSFIGVTAG